MANEEHLAQLRRGAEAWNTWRKKNPGIQLDLCKTHFTGEDLSELDLIGVDLGERSLYGFDLSGIDLREASLISMDLMHIGFPGADLRGAMLAEARLIGIDFTGANLGEVLFDGALLYRVNFTGADLHRARFNWTTLSDVDLSVARRLDTIQYDGPSTIGIDTLYRSHGNIPETFLRGCGVPDEFITYVRSLVGHPFEYHSCFISYSSKDTALAERLYADLQATGVRCWFAPENMKIGANSGPVLIRPFTFMTNFCSFCPSIPLGVHGSKKKLRRPLQRSRKSNALFYFPSELTKPSCSMTRIGLLTSTARGTSAIFAGGKLTMATEQRSTDCFAI